MVLLFSHKAAAVESLESGSSPLEQGCRGCSPVSGSWQFVRKKRARTLMTTGTRQCEVNVKWHQVRAFEQAVPAFSRNDGSEKVWPRRWQGAALGEVGAGGDSRLPPSSPAWEQQAVGVGSFSLHSGNGKMSRVISEAEGQTALSWNYSSFPC